MESPATWHLQEVVVQRLLDWLERGVQPHAERAPGGGYVLRYGRRYRVATIAIALPYSLFCVGWILAYVFGNDISAGQFLACGAVIGGMWAAAVWLALEVCCRTFRLQEAGFEVCRPFLGCIVVAWADIEAVRYSALLKALTVHRRRGRCCRLFTGLNGLGTFRAYLARYAPGVADTAAGGRDAPGHYPARMDRPAV